MYHEYYNYDKAQLLSNPKIPMEVMEDKPTVFKSIAREMADTILEKNAKGETTVFICLMVLIIGISISNGWRYAH